MERSANRPSLHIGLATVGLLLCAEAVAIGNPFKRAKAGTETEVLLGEPVAECQGRQKASIAVSRFENKARNASYYRSGVGDGMADQLTTALVATGCFKVVDRQNLKGVMDEMGFQQSGLVEGSSASRVGKMVGADLIVTAAVTEFQENTSGSRGAAGGGAGAGGLGAIIGGIRRSSNSAHMAVDLRITDVETTEIIGATAVKGTAKDVKAGALLGAIVPGAAGLGALEDWENTPRGAALRKVIEQAVGSVRRMIPDGYYRHNVGRFAAAPSARGGARSGGGGSGVVRKAQSVLKEFGLYTGAVDGMDGPGTQAAVRAFQQQLGLPETGKLDLKTMKEINAMTN